MCLDNITFYSDDGIYECYVHSEEDYEYLSVVKNGQPMSYVVPWRQARPISEVIEKATHNEKEKKKLFSFIKSNLNCDD